MSISLLAANQESYVKGGSTIEANNAAALIGINTSFPANQVQFTFSQGTPATNSFVPGPRSSNPTLSVDLVAGNWTTSTGLSGTLSGAQLTALNTNQRNLRNAVENLANAINMIPGSIVAWT